ncbi:hypothetical protein AB0C07_18350 [Actinoplanes missouriensis]|uniref:hypothetical protein n=1 Tax=Actinoplanes missouriensis TaxID=1866 RepID=UPI0033DD2ACD
MHHANHYYGHSYALARYCGLTPGDVPPRIHGYLQHGWNIGDGLAPDHEYVPGISSFVWSERTRRRAWSMGRRRVHVTGAPMAYLLTLSPRPGHRDGTIWYPFHGWEGQHVQGDHDRLIAEITETEPGPVTVCLYWQEYRTAAVRRRYERAGFRVICHGYRGGWWKDLDPGFLDRQLAELLRHRRVASNRLCSAVLYGALAGCEPAVYGDPMQLHGERDLFGGRPRIRRQWAELHGKEVDPAVAHAIAVDELGADRLLPPAELRALFHWSSASAVAA